MDEETKIKGLKEAEKSQTSSGKSGLVPFIIYTGFVAMISSLCGLALGTDPVFFVGLGMVVVGLVLHVLSGRSRSSF